MCYLEMGCSFGSCYIGQTKHNAQVRWNKHNPTKISEPSKHLQSNIKTILHRVSFQILQKMLRP